MLQGVNFPSMENNVKNLVTSLYYNLVGSNFFFSSKRFYRENDIIAYNCPICGVKLRVDRNGTNYVVCRSWRRKIVRTFPSKMEENKRENI